MQVSGEIESIDALREFVIGVPTRAGQSNNIVRLKDIAQIRAMPPDPPEDAAIYKGESAV